MQYGYYLLPEISEQRMSGMLREIEEELSKKLKSSSANVSLFIYCR